MRAARSLRVLFVVQGEGRGHQTQALALAPMLRTRGHKVVGAIVGVGRWGDVPTFFRRGLNAPVETVESPGFVSGDDGRIRPASTVAKAIREVGRYRRSLDQISRTIDRVEPDVIVNFYEGLMGAHTLLRVTDAPVVAVGHQFMASQPGYPSVAGQPAQRVAMNAYTRLVAAGTTSRLALSFYDAEHATATVTPPLLRSSLFALEGRPTDGSILVYLMDGSMAPDLVAWSDRNPGVRIHAFSSSRPHEHSTALTFHGLSGTAFLERMSVARGVVCTAGFETVSEAMWLGVPALMTPTPGHYEQRCNAVDAAASGAGVMSDTIGLDPLLDALEAEPPDPASFRRWVGRAGPIAVGAVEDAAGLPQLPPSAGDGAVTGLEVDAPAVRAAPA
ncbi:glycosyltransferase family protein [Rubrivirga sp.]|uniref:glycosyltransferase family protein n=1 Tax=Rubrivirga sp. TaxID=1885344 RepID=UPI003C752349